MRGVPTDTPHFVPIKVLSSYLQKSPIRQVNVLIMSAEPKRSTVETFNAYHEHHNASAATYEQPLTDSERNAMRAYLQRTEVRLSTLHRIATAFISGAGLLLLIPVFFKDAVDNLLTVLLANTSNQFETLGTLGIVLTILLYACLLYPLLLSLIIPLYGVWLLLKDIVHFYFTIYMPGFSENLLNPTFALSALMFSVDESPRGKRQVMRHQYDRSHMGYVMPFSEERKELYFDDLIENTDGQIIPSSRSIEELDAAGVLPPEVDTQEINRFNAALGIARGLDRTLAQEVAVAELSLARHVLYLRRLVLRYVKTLLMFIWTTAISFMMLPLLKDGRFPIFLVFAAAYFIWVIAVMPIIEWPVTWLYRHRHEKPPIERIDAQLRQMQDLIAPYVKIGIGIVGLALILALASLVL